jgi:hypothetical protein
MKALLAGFLFALLGTALGADAPIAEAMFQSADGADAILLYAERGECPPEWRKSQYIYRPRVGILVPGCWRNDEQFVYIVFKDGDSGRIALDAFTWKRGQRPTTM